MEGGYNMNFNPLIPELSVSDFERSLAFYTEVLPFLIDFQRPEHRFAFLSLQGSQIMIEEQNGHWDTASLEYPYGRGINLAIQVDDLDMVISSLESHNHPIKFGPKDKWYRMNDKLLGNRELLALDPDGYLLRFLKHLGSRPID
jgi:catechol 2,3-dioxygenase-like lactoylglutathione lyase family enzyme